MRLTIPMSLLLAFAVMGCSRNAPPASPPTHGIQTFGFHFPTTNFLSKTDVLTKVTSFASQHSLPSRGRAMTNDVPDWTYGGWPAEAYGFGYLPCYTNVYIWVGFQSPWQQTRIVCMYCGTNDSFFHDYHVAFEQFIETNFAEEKNFVRTNQWLR
jgi:hypothetical protein